MKNSTKKCSSKGHEKNNAICFCAECKVYMCNECESFHSKLLSNHHSYNLDINIKNIFTGFCKEENHLEKLDYFCITHNQLCCASCIAKVKSKGKGQHTDCDICNFEDIKEEKKDKLKKNIEILESLYSTVDESINQLKKIFEKIYENKSELVLKVQKLFTKIRAKLNEREDQLLSEIDKEFNELFIKEEIFKESQDLPRQVKLSLKKGKIIEEDWDNEDKINSIINDCVTIENNIRNINEINENINKCKNSINLDIIFHPIDGKDNNEINKLCEMIECFGSIYCKGHFKYKFKKCPSDIEESKKYSVTGEKENIVTKIGLDNKRLGVMCEYKLEKNIKHKWKIRILKSKTNDILVGIAPIDFNINTSTYTTCGWYYSCDDSKLYSGPPYNYSCKPTNLPKVKDEITVVMDMNQRTLKFIVNNKDQGVSYENIPIDKPLFPTVFLVNKDDSIEIVEC